MESGFTKAAENAINDARLEAANLGHAFIGTEHLLLGLLCKSDGAAYKILSARGISYSAVKSSVEKHRGVGEFSSPGANDLTPRVREIIYASSAEARRHGAEEIGTEHLLITIVTESECTASRIITSLGVRLSELYTDLASAICIRGEAQQKPKKRTRDMPLLRQYGKNLCLCQKRGFNVVGRDEECRRIIEILCRKTKNNPCLIGEAGVGKTAVVEALAEKIVKGDVPELLLRKSIVSLDLTAMLAGAKYRGEFEDRLKGVMAEAEDNPNIILFIDEIHTVVGAGAAEGAIDAANVMKPALGRGTISVIGATTVSEYRKSIERDGALCRRFQTVAIEEPSREKTLDILKSVKLELEEHHGVKITDGAVQASLFLSDRFIPERSRPDKCIDLLDSASSSVKLSRCSDAIGCDLDAALYSGDITALSRLRRAEVSQGTDISVTEKDIEAAVAKAAGLPPVTVSRSEATTLLMLEDELKKRVVGQNEAITKVAKAVRRGRSGLGDPDRPWASFLFTGRTGTGKTELCRALSDILFGDKKSFIRLDMSEYMEKHSVSRLIGSPPGYVGYGQGGQLTEAVRSSPNCIVLFDEAEKAHPDIFGLLLQILEEGELTDPLGVKVNFRSAIIILTSNIGSDEIQRALGFGQGGNVPDRALKSYFKPELLGRLDGVIRFSPLDRESLFEITKKYLTVLEKRLSDKGVRLIYGDNTARKIAEAGEGEGGARAIRRYITEHIENGIADLLLQNENVKEVHLSYSEKDVTIYTEQAS